MCGLTGIWDLNKKTTKGDLKSQCSAMTQILNHRGPDNQRIWQSESESICIGFRRLSIIDLSKNGNQPMQTNDGRFCVVFNGEIYNYKDLRKELETEGAIFFSNSDSEVLKEAFSYWGIARTVSKLNGMFAIAVWDKKNKSIFLIRDRLGIKPLYWFYDKNLIAFASELKSFKKLNNINLEIDRESLEKYLIFGNVPAPFTIFKNTMKLKPGTIIEINSEGRIKEKRFWDLFSIISTKQNNYSFSSERLEELILNSVKLRLVSDVPVGAFLSSGIDSSLIVSMMQKISSKPIKTYTIGFDEDGFDESKEAQKISSFLKTEHSEFFINKKILKETFSNLGEIWDEPFADFSQIPTYLVSKLSKKDVTVVLTGYGGDELFYGYERYNIIQSVWESTKYLSPFLCKLIIKIIQNTPFIPNNMKRFSTHLSEKSQGKSLLHSYMFHLTNNFQNVDKILNKSNLNYEKIYKIEDFKDKNLNLKDLVRYIDLVTYLPDKLLTKLDRASMFNSLEARTPLLDHNVVEYVWSMPNNLLKKNGKNKWIIRNILKKYIPEHLVDNPKKGFSAPIKYWMKSFLKPFCEDLLSESNLKQHNLFDIKVVQEIWQNHKENKQNNSPILWTLLMFQLWYKNWNRALLK